MFAGNDTNFDMVESTSHKLVHLTALRAKGPKKRPPSTVLVLGVCMLAWLTLGGLPLTRTYYHSFTPCPSLLSSLHCSDG